MIVNHNLHIDLVKRGCQPIVAAVQGEANTRQLTISLFSNSVAWEIPTGATAAVAFQKPDGTKGLYDHLPDGSAATTTSGNTVTAILAPQALTCAGTVLASIVFYDADQDTLATFPFKVVVEANPAADEQVSNSYYYLQNLEQVNEAYAALLVQTGMIVDIGREVQGIRTGFDGTVYPTAGEAVRAQGVKIEVETFEDEAQPVALAIEDTPAVASADGVTVTNYFVNGNFENADGWGVNSGNTINVANNVAAVRNGSSTSGIKISQGTNKDIVAQTAGDIWFLKIHFKPDTNGSFVENQPVLRLAANTAGGYISAKQVQPAREEIDCYATFTLNADSNSGMTIAITANYGSGDTLTEERTSYFSKAVLVNLTQAYGAGNEPTAEEFYSLLSTREGAYFDGTTTLDGTGGGGEPSEPDEPDNPGGGNTDVVSGSGYKLIITTAKGTETLYLYQGQPGTPGKNGTNGKDGVSPTITVEEIEGGNRLTITDKNGTQSVDLLNGTQNEAPTDTKITLTVADGYLLDIRGIYRQDNYGGVTRIDWGDGSANDIVGKTDDEMKHKYTTGGTYTLTLTGLTHLPALTFREKGVSAVEIGSAVEFMGYFAFQGNPNLTEVRIYADVPPEMTLSSGGWGAFDASVTKITVPTDSMYAYTKAPGWGKYVGVLTADEFMTNVFGDKVVTVGAGGDFATINDALNYISMFYPMYRQGGIGVEIKILSGTTIAEQIGVQRIDLSYVTITAEDAEVPVNGTGFVIFAGLDAHDLRGDVAFIGGENAAKLPTIGCLFKLIAQPTDGRGVVGYFANRGSNGVVLAGAGFDGFYDGVIANNESSITIREGIARNCTRWGVHARHNGEVSARSCDLSNSGEIAAYADRVANLDAREANVNGSKIALAAYNGSIINGNMDEPITNCGNGATAIIQSKFGSLVNVASTQFVNSQATIIEVAAGGLVSANGITVSNSADGVETFSQAVNTITANGIIFN